MYLFISFSFDSPWVFYKEVGSSYIELSLPHVFFIFFTSDTKIFKHRTVKWSGIIEYIKSLKSWTTVSEQQLLLYYSKRTSFTVFAMHNFVFSRSLIILLVVLA